MTKNSHEDDASDANTEATPAEPAPELGSFPDDEPDSEPLAGAPRTIVDAAADAAAAHMGRRRVKEPEAKPLTGREAFEAWHEGHK